MLERIRALPGTELGTSAYLDDFWSHFQELTGDFWKLERCQHFIEPGVPSWDAFAAGRWDEARRLAEETRPQVEQYVRDSRHLNRRRIRVVEHPVTSYLQWEMQMLRVRAEAGDAIRVLDAGDVRSYEADAATGLVLDILPELIVVGSSVLYEVTYDASAALSGGRRIDDPDVIKESRAELESLYATGEDLLDYFERAIAPLPPPQV